MALLIDPPLRNSCWLNTFVTSTHNDTLNKFATYLNNTSINERKIAAGTKPSVAFLIAHPDKVAKLVHYLYHDNGTSLSTSTNNDVLALHRHDVVAAPVLIPKESFKALMPDSTVPTWEHFVECTSAEDVAALEPPTTTPKTFKCFNLVALPAFLTNIKTLMQLDSLDPKVLGFATIKAICEHATNRAVTGLAPGDEDTSAATIAEEGASLVFILQFLWLLETKAYTVDPANMLMSPQARDWAQRQHTQWIT